MSTRYEEDNFYKCFIGAFWYHHGEDHIALVGKLLELASSMVDGQNIYPFEVDPWWQQDEIANFLWSILVGMFGDCITDPEAGHLIVSKELISFLKDMNEDLTDMSA